MDQLDKMGQKEEGANRAVKKGHAITSLEQVLATTVRRNVCYFVGNWRRPKGWRPLLICVISMEGNRMRLRLLSYRQG